MSVGDDSVQALVVEVSEAPAGVAAVADRIEEACRSGERFAVLIDARGAGDAMAGPDRRALLGRLRALRPQLREWCAGVAFLAPATGAGERGRRLRAARLLFGCPVEAFGSLDAASAWLAAHGATLLP
jgi:hypothetical protein